MAEELKSRARQFQEILQGLGFENLQVVQFSESTRTSAEAAVACGCEVGQIAKSLIFKTKQSHKPVLVIASGANRVNEKAVSGLVGEKFDRADADFVRACTGYAIGGIPPIGHTEKLLTFIDEDLLQYSEIWAAAGTPNAVFKLTPPDLVKMTGGQVINVK